MANQPEPEASRPPLKQHKQVSVEPAIQKSYVGRYQIPPEAAPNVVISVRWEGDHLTVQENEEPKQDLLPESPTQFYTIADDVYTFDTDAQGRVTQMVLHIPGHDIPAKPIP